MGFRADQPLNDWVVMLDGIYGGSQNYAKTPYEIHAHLTEVCGVFAKHLFKRQDEQEARQFLPKIFAWSAALLRKMRPGRVELEDIIFRKFPNACSYCLKKPCSCWQGEKPSLDEQQLRKLYYLEGSTQRRSANDFQRMFRDVYSESWGILKKTQAGELRRPVFIRLVEEIAELCESIRFHHLYPENFENELADFLAWWFALVSTFPASTSSTEILLAEDCLWRAYPGQCPDCQMVPCLCRPGPVRQLMSRPVPGYDHRFDSLTSTLNQMAYSEDVKSVESGETALTFPSSCARLDVDGFKSVNDTHGHPAGDEALRHIASVIRRAIRERDRPYRISGDEFGVLCANFTEEEITGTMRRVCAALQKQPVRWVSQSGTVQEFNVSASVGVAEFSSSTQVREAFGLADQASYRSKETGKGNITKASSLAGENQ